MFIDFLADVFRKSANDEAIIFQDQSYSYQWLLDKINYWQNHLKQDKVEPGTVVVLEADFSPNAIALLLALIENSCIAVPLSSSAEVKKEEFIEIAQAQISFVVNSSDDFEIKKLGYTSKHELYEKLKNSNLPGLLLFSSGTTGKSKATLHDFSHLLQKYKTPRHNFRTLTFLLFDHIGGIDTLFYSLSNGSCIITINDRNPENVCKTIEKFKVEVLPVSPSFLNLLFLSKAYEKYDMSSLKYITYGAEVMPATTLKRCASVFPDVTILQKYGVTEVGTLRSKSKSSNSLWVKIGGEGYETRVIDDILQIKADAAMVGYLNAPSPFTEDGWFITGDRVEVQGEYMRILGRESDIINVGGEKVNPSEVEDVILQFNNIADVTVFGEMNPLLGNIVCARITTLELVNKAQFERELKRFCQQKLQSYKVPMKIYYSDSAQHTIRYKKLRGTSGGG